MKDKKEVKRDILSDSRQFKGFWKEHGPFKFALTSTDYPPVLLEPEEWLFSNDLISLLKHLMQFDQRHIRLVRSDFNPDNKNILRPGELIPWRIKNFPEEWNGLQSDIFVPEGYLTRNVLDRLDKSDQNSDENQIETAFFLSLADAVDQLGYSLFKPARGAKAAAMGKYLEEWEKDDRDAGLDSE